MKTHLLVGLTVVNLALLLFTLAGLRSVTAQGTQPVLRGRSLEIVDDEGRLRAFLGVLPANQNNRMPNGKTVPETVILRLMDPGTGRPSVKLTTSEQGSALGPLGESRTEETWAIVDADGTASSIRLRNEREPERHLTR